MSCSPGAARHPAQLLAAGAAPTVPVSGPHLQTPIDPTVLHAACRSATRRGGARQASERACAAAQLRHPSAGKRRRHPHHPGVARSRESVDDSTLHARLDAAHWQYRKPLGSALAERDAAGIVGDGAAGVRTGRRLSPPRRDLCSIERRTSRARRTARDRRRSRPAARRRWAVTSNAATIAASRASPTTPAATAIAQNAKARRG